MHNRPYGGLADLRKIQALLRDGQARFPFNGYMHPGDVEWWLFYNPYGDLPADFLHLWEDERGNLLAFSVLQELERTIGFFMHPDQRHADMANHLLEWSETALRAMQTNETESSIEMVFSGDTLLMDLLAARGYTQHPYLTLFSRDLTQPIPEIVLPAGYRFLERMTPAFMQERVNIHVGGFRHSRMTAAYYRNFMKSAPLYQPELDVIAATDDGRGVSAAILWADELSQTAEFEPVATHHEFQRRGIGRAVLREGMRRLQARGIKQATVMTKTEDTQNVAFYLNAGFEFRTEIFIYKKTLV
jgi:ribosomal protein S18 acetylase RimI-like enzyme